MEILYLKALHIIFAISWFAGLFFMVRIFVYHAEANSKPEPERSALINHFKKMSKPLWFGINWPAAIGTWLFGLTMAIKIYGVDWPQWLIIKFCFVIGLTLYHLRCHFIFRQLQKDIIEIRGLQMRLWNEVATLFLVAIIFIVVFKGNADWWMGVLGFILFGSVLFAAVRTVKKLREKK